MEVTQALRRYAAAGVIEESIAADALDDLAGLDVTRYAHELFLPRVWELRANVTAYDAAYLALAEGLGAPLVTFDRRLAASPGHRAVVELLGT